MSREYANTRHTQCPQWYQHCWCRGSFSSTLPQSKKMGKKTGKKMGKKMGKQMLGMETMCKKSRWQVQSAEQPWLCQQQCSCTIWFIVSLFGSWSWTHAASWAGAKTSLFYLSGALPPWLMPGQICRSALSLTLNANHAAVQSCSLGAIVDICRVVYKVCVKSCWVFAIVGTSAA